MDFQKNIFLIPYKNISVNIWFSEQRLYIEWQYPN